MRRTYSAAPNAVNRPAIAVAKAVATKDLPGAQPSVLPDNVQQTDIYTYFTVAGETKLLTSASRWTFVRLFLETAGPVAVGTRHIITPVLSGKGVLLPTGSELSFTLAPGNRLYIAAESVNRVKTILEPFAYLDQIYKQQLIGNTGGKR
jgi:hypothetical protein